MNAKNGYTLVIDDMLSGLKEAHINEQLKEISVSPAVFSLLHDSDSRASVLEQILFYELNFF